MASYTQEQLEHYITHPEEVDATDTDLVEALARAETTVLTEIEERDAGRKAAGEDATDTDAEAAKKAVDDAAAKAEADAKAAAEAKATADADAAKAAAKGGEGGATEQEGAILTKDGKHTLPFGVLEEARSGRAAAEAALRETQQQVLDLTNRVKDLAAGKVDPGAGEATPDELEKALEGMAAEAPWSKPHLEPVIAAVREMKATLAELLAERDETEEQAASRLRSQRTAAMEGNATLVLWQTKAPELFNEAVAFDKTLRENPAMRSKYPTFDARFARVVDLVKANHAGEAILLPDPVTGVKPAAGAAPAKAAVPSAEEKARAEKALADAATRTSVLTLTDVPGGAGERTEQEVLERMSAHEIAAKFAGMSSNDLISWINQH